MTEKFDPLGEAFVRSTFYTNMERTPESQDAEFPPYLPLVADESQLIRLTPPTDIQTETRDLREIMENRRSVRRYDQSTPMTLDELSYLLWLTQGIKKVSEKTGMSIRTVPSAGARHPFETYLSINNVSGLEQGIYHYIAHLHALELIQAGADGAASLFEACLNQNQVLTSAVTFIWTAVPYRTCWRYGSRGYRYLYVDAGHVCQNLHLAAESIDYGVCAIGAFEDEAVNALLNLDGKEQFAIYLASCGKKPA